MGVFCEIKLFKPSDGVYHPGQTVAGVIKYTVDEPLEVESIVISLKGSGSTFIKVTRGRYFDDIYTSNEVFVDIDNIVQATKAKLLIGAYEVGFNYTLPLNIPSSVRVVRNSGRYTVHSLIRYYIRLKIKKTGLFSFNTHFRKDLTVISEDIIPKLLREPVSYGEQKKLLTLFSSKNNIVNVKATILNSVIPIGDKIEVHYEVENNSDVSIKSTKTKLIEVHTFITSGRTIELDRGIPDSDAKTASIKSGCKQHIQTEINVPADLHSIENCAVFFRHYLVRMTVELPLPHKNAILNIPVQIGKIIEHDEAVGGIYQHTMNEVSPPSYWEAMNEEKNDDFKLKL